MTAEPVVNLYPDDPRQPRAWTSEDGGAPTVSLRRAPDGAWTALFDRHAVARGPTPEALTAQLLSEHGLLAVLADHGLTADA